MKFAEIASYVGTTALGTAFGWALNRFMEKPLDRWLQQGRRRWRHRAGTRAKAKGPAAHGQDERFRIGGVPVNWVVLDGGSGLKAGYPQENLQTRFVAGGEALPPEFLALRELLAREEEERRQSGESAAWNGSRYQIRRYLLDRTAFDEEPQLICHFGPTDYLSFLTSQRLLNCHDTTAPWYSLAEAARQWHPFDQPLPFMGHSFGLNLIPITADGLAVIAQRGLRNRIAPGYFGAGVNEGLQRPADDNAQKAPDFYRAAVRGCFEELGVVPKEQDIHFLSFGVDPVLQQYGLLGTVQLSLRSSELLAVRRTGTQDKWEARQVDFVPLDARHVAEALRQRQPWGAAGAVALVHALIQEDGSVSRVLNRLQQYA